MIKINFTSLQSIILTAKHNFEHNRLDFGTVLKNTKETFQKHNWLKPFINHHKLTYRSRKLSPTCTTSGNKMEILNCSEEG